MDPNQAVVGNHTESRAQRELTGRNELDLEHELENRMRNLEKLAESLCSTLGRESFSGKAHALRLANELHVTIKATREMFRIARLLREPARTSMLSSVRTSVRALEGQIASRFGVDMI